MDTFHLALLLVLAGGVLPLLLGRAFGFMKIVAIALIGAGCLTSLSGAWSLLASDTVVRAAVPLFGGIDLSFRIDALASYFLLPISLICPIAAFYSYHYLDNEGKGARVAANYFFFSILTISMGLVAAADNIVTFALSWELMSLSSFFLVIYDYDKRATRRAGYLYFAFAQAGAMILFASFAVIFSHTGSLDFAAIGTVPDTAKALIFTLAFIGFGSKAGIMPLHVWLPHAHPAAPSHVSAVMSGVMIKMGIYGILRIYTLLHPQGTYCATLVISIGAITGVFGVVYALGQKNMKRLLAYSSVENIGIILLGIGLGMLGVSANNPVMAGLGFAGALMHIINHAIFKSLLFMGAGAVQHHAHTLAIEKLGGLMKKMRLCGTAFLVGSLAICGLPPFNGFVGEFLIYGSGLHGMRTAFGSFMLVVVTILSLAIIGGLAIACFTKLVGMVFLGEPRSEQAAQATPPGATIHAALVLLAVFCTGIGLAPQVILPMVGHATAPLMPGGVLPPELQLGSTAHHLSTAAIAFAALVLLITIVRQVIGRGTPARSGTWGCGFTQASPRVQYTGTSFTLDFLKFYNPFVQVKEKFSGINGLFPADTHYTCETVDVTESGLHRAVVSPLMHFTARLRWLQHGHIQLYIGYIFFAVIGLLFWLIW